MKKAYSKSGITVFQGDCREVMRKGTPDSIDAVICDPPYELGFMGKKWDGLGIAYDPDTWREAYRVLKPGGHLLAFGGTRTFHRIAVAIEDAGFEIRDSLAWMHGQGFPKGKSQLKPAFEPIIMARKPFKGTIIENEKRYATGSLNIDGCRVTSGDKLVRPEIQRLDNQVLGKGLGAGTQVEPGGRWPTNVLLDESQAAILDEQSGTSKSTQRSGKRSGILEFVGQDDVIMGHSDIGGASRFFPVFKYQAKAPTKERPKYWHKSCNCETVKPCQSQPRDTTESESVEGTSWSTSTSGSKRTNGKSHRAMISTIKTKTNSTTKLKTSSSLQNLSTNESTRDANSEKGSGGSHVQSASGLSQFPMNIGTSVQKDGLSMVAADPATLDGWSEKSVCANCGQKSKIESHATVKPLELMRWLCKLVTPEGGRILDPFAGSGTTLEAALLEGFEAIGVEFEAEYVPLIIQRLSKHA